MYKLMAVVMLAASQASAAVTYISQERRITASASDTNSLESADFRPFHADVVGNFIEFDSGGTPYSLPASMASQDSFLVSNAIIATGSISAEDGVQGLGSEAIAKCRVVFAIDRPTTYNLTGYWSHGITFEDSAPRTASITLSGVDTIYSSQYPENNILKFQTIYYINSSGTLQPGEYAFDVDFKWRNHHLGSGGDPGTPMRYNVILELTVPAPSTAAMSLLGMMSIIRRRR